MSSDDESPGSALSHALRGVTDAYAVARGVIESTNDPHQAFKLATELRDRIDELVGRSADLRAQMVSRVAQDEQLSLAALAERIGVSKSRADQFIKAARASAVNEEGETK